MHLGIRWSRALNVVELAEVAARLAHADLRDLAVEYVPFEVLAPRARALRDAATLDLPLTRAPGVRCAFLVPGDPLP